MNCRGGYIVTRIPLVHAGDNLHTGALERPFSDADLHAVNVVQETAWRVNGFIVDTMWEAISRGLQVGGLEMGQPVPVPPRIEDATWAAMTADDQKLHKLARMRAHAQNATVEGRTHGVLSALTVATEMRGRERVWYPHVKDFRGRIYPGATIGPQPQGSDIQKALIMFAAGLPLGPDGLFWLAVRAAGCAGLDKLALQDRVEWTLGQRERIVATVADPFADLWWAELEEPWQFLATAHELSLAFSSENPDGFFSHLPIPLDGTCNGLQHLSAMGLDPVGAAATNLCGATGRRDVYQEVANAVTLLVDADVAAGNECALQWQGNVSRKTVKRAVMTTPYGVTNRGIRDQLLGDDLVPDVERRGVAADYLRDKILIALDNTVVGARRIMSWMQKCAEVVTRTGQPLRWHTPIGSTIQQGYQQAAIERIESLLGRINIVSDTAETPLVPRKNAAGSAPNIIHSFDAAHLSLTVNACHDAGMRSFSMIHDSYGTHACNTTELGVILRDQFVRIYQQNWLAKLRENFQQCAPAADLREPPTRGMFNIGEVRDAAFFFS